MKEKLTQILRTLNQISVQGSINLNRLLGCIQAIEQMLNEISLQQKDKETNDNG